MTDTAIYKDIAGRTHGDVYIGVVGPVRSIFLPASSRAGQPPPIPDARNSGSPQTVCRVRSAPSRHVPPSAGSSRAENPRPSRRTSQASRSSRAPRSPCGYRIPPLPQTSPVRCATAYVPCAYRRLPRRPVPPVSYTPHSPPV
ncbi:MAG: hypothetical protein J6N32_03620 [Clostridia bacterium]|nr:hypothetical protein [Clostridia bacterium]